MIFMNWNTDHITIMIVFIIVNSHRFTIVIALFSPLLRPGKLLWWLILYSIEHDYSCTVHAKLYTIGEYAETIAEFSLDLVSPVEYLFRKFSANEFGKPQQYYCSLHCSGMNKGKKLVGRFFEDRTFCRLLTAISLKMYSKIGRIKWTKC